ncbi:hypothetical protein [Mycolicibacterium stellerae]|uniref:hypothetical protein n=1 Tax=Mycolicibacterium stellerae TaxID=2358193 RepID=UPI0013DE2F75|nr:hypothetical protein [Mycolicibacterium stellerae]
MQKAAEVNLAWALIEVVKPRLSLHERDFVFVTIGAGDTFAAIRQLLGLVVAKGIPLRPQFVHLCATWLDAYVGHDQERCLSRAIEGLLTPSSIRAATLTRTSSRLTARHGRPSAVDRRLGPASAPS